MNRPVDHSNHDRPTEADGEALDLDQDGEAVLETVENTIEYRPDLPFERIVSLCEEFTGEWQPTHRPSIPSYLERVADDARETLLRNLLQYEILKRRKQGDDPQAEEYIHHLPQFAGLVRQLFLESMSPYASLEPEGPALETGSFRHLAAKRLGDYRLVRELGRGGMGVVFEAIHVRRGNRVALKLLPMVDGPRLFRFKREFRSAADLNHPNLIGLHTLELAGSQWFFTMDLIEGTDFLAYVRPGDRLDEARLRSALSQLSLGLMALHRNHIVHCDLKPSNVMVTRKGQVLLLDFGLVAELDLANASMAAGQVLGTPAYMAPEQAGALGVTPQSDWYAVGVMLYEALSGQLPFQGSISKIMLDKQLLDPRPLPDDPSIPKDLAAFCSKLLERAPERRPGTLEIARQIASELKVNPNADEGGPLVGRRQHLAALSEAYRALERTSSPQTVFVLGRSGEGKTTLAEHFLTTIREDERSIVMAGRCYERESVPFKALDTQIDALAGYLRTLPETDAALLMPDDIGVLARVFPVLQRVDVVARAAAVRVSALDEQQVRRRAFEALRTLLARLTRHGSIVWFIDDLQWGDSDSAEVLFEMLRPPNAPAMLFIGTYRSDEAETSRFLSTWKELQRKHGVTFADVEVRIAPLTPEECVEVVVRTLDRDDPAIRRRALEFAIETGGNPFLLTELVGSFDPDNDTLQVAPIREVIGRKLEALPLEAGKLLEIVAISGQSLALLEASMAAGCDAPPFSTVNRMRTGRLLRMVGAEDDARIDTYHDKIRETVLGQMDDPGRRKLHKALAETIESGGHGVRPEEIATIESGQPSDVSRNALARVYDLAYHFDAAEDSRKAWVYGLLAAEQARGQFAHEVAAEQYRISSKNAEGAPEAVRFRISEGFGETLMLLGRYPAAMEQLEIARGLAGDPLTLARVEALQGETMFKQGMILDCSTVYERALRRLGVWVPRSEWGFALGAIREAFIQTIHSLTTPKPCPEADRPRMELAVRLLARLTYPMWFRSSSRMLWTHLTSLNRCEHLPSSRIKALIHSGHAICTLFWISRGLRYNSRGVEMSRELNDIYAEGHCYHFGGMALYASGRYEEALEYHKLAISLFDRTGDLWEYNMAHYHVACCNYRLGNLAEAVEAAQATFERAIRIGDDALPHLCVDVWAKASEGRLPFPELRSCFQPIPEDIQSSSQILQAEALWLAGKGRTAEALHASEQAFRLPQHHVLYNFLTVPSIPSLATTIRLHADASAGVDPSLARKLRARGLRVARWASRVSVLFPTDRPHALRELGLALQADGHLKRALKAIEQSCEVAGRQKARYELAKSNLVRATIRRQLGFLGDPSAIESAQAALDVFWSPPPQDPTAAIPTKV